MMPDGKDSDRFFPDYRRKVKQHRLKLYKRS
jgi:hypothetical protein